MKTSWQDSLLLNDARTLFLQRLLEFMVNVKFQSCCFNWTDQSEINIYELNFE